MPDDEKPMEENVVPSAPADNSAVPSEPMPGDPIAPEGSKTVPIAALHEERDKRQSLQAELEILRQVAGDQVYFDANGRPVPRGNSAPVASDPGQSHVAEEIEKLWENDPRKAVQMEIMSAMSWRDKQDADVDAQESQASQKYNDYSQYRDTVRQYVRALPLDQRAKPGVIDLAYYVVKGQASGSIYERAQADILRRIQAGENVQGLGGGTVAAPVTLKGVKASAEQTAAAEMMGMSVEDYMANKVPGPAAAR